MNEAMAPAGVQPAVRTFRGLEYPFGRSVPEPGMLTEVAEGVHWLRMPLPMSLNHINLYVLDGGDSWTLIDTGMRTSATKALWEQLLAGPLAAKPVGAVVGTHFHPDHLGLAGWLCARTGAPLLMSRTEYLLAAMLILGAQPEPPEAAMRFYARAGWGEADLETFRKRGWSGFARVVHPLPASYRRLQAGDVLPVGPNLWRIVEGRGHSPEHLCLVCDSLGVMIAGDQVLPRITPNVSVTPTEPEGNPLRDWLESIERLRALDPGLLVLPAHGEPFLGLHTRLDQMAEDHERKLARLLAHCAEPRRVVDCFEVLFQQVITVDDIMSATGEALAHLHYLEYCGRIEGREKDGVMLYSVC
ncbi:MBL fold metallo-hydrolase [Pedomonas sp. V897]|uniref:MBL fold metallo-hydrolase n=1 Tax=Pedomonas sp. V897 TaxID=3446482 RepID=UPI003EDFC849